MAETLKQAIQRVTNELRKQFGTDTAVIVIVGRPENNEIHSERFWYWDGRCNEAAGALSLSAPQIMEDIRRSATNG